MFKEKFDKAKEFVVENKTKVGAVVGLGILGIVMAVRHKRPVYEVQDFVDFTEHPDEVLKDGEWVPIKYDDTTYYSDVFANESVKRDFRDMGYKIVEREGA